MSKNNYIKFDVAVRNYYGSNNAAMAFARLLYWCNKIPGGFYKFKRPCPRNALYKKGDSWEEELGMSRRELDPVFQRLVSSYRSKNDYLKQTDKFKGKMFVSYRNRKTNQTYYFMNKEAVDAFLNSITKSKSPSLPSPTSNVHEGVDNLEPQAKIMALPLSSTAQDVPPLARAHPPVINIQTNTSLASAVHGEVFDPEREKEKLSSKKMVEIWNSHAQDKVVWFPSIASRLYRVLVDYFGSCLDTFRKYCLSIASSKFLMGKAPNSKFKAFLFWVIKPEVIKSIIQGAYGVQSLLSKIGNESEVDKLEKEYNTIGYEIINAESKVEYSKKEIIEAQDKMIRELKSSISAEVKDQILESVQHEVNQKYPVGDYSIKNRETLVSVQYHTALVDYSRAMLGFCHPDDIVTPQELLDEVMRLRERRVEIGKRLQEIAKQNHQEQQRMQELVEKAC